MAKTEARMKGSGGGNRPPVRSKANYYPATGLPRVGMIPHLGLRP